MEPATATVKVTVVTAIWQARSVFAGTFEVSLARSDAGARYTFRAVQEQDGITFTHLQPLPGGPDRDEALQVLTAALERTLPLLQARTLERFREGQLAGAQTEGFDLSALGFEVSVPFEPAGEEAWRALRLLVRGGESQTH